jgi:anti-sigma factor RsiW
MIERLRTISLPRRHPRRAVLSDYIDGDLDARERRALETHIRDCCRCRRELASLANTVHALGSVEADTPPGLADSIIAALRTEDPPELATGKRAADAAGQPWLKVVPGPGRPSARQPIRSRWPQEARAALRWCLRRPQLRLTLPIAVIAGVVLSLVNMGGMLMHGKIDLGVCVSCAIDFLVPFLALNLGLLMLLWLPRRRRL